MARRWSLPGQFAELIECHVAVETLATQLPPESRPRLAVALSALLPAANDPFWGESAAFEACYEKVARRGVPRRRRCLGKSTPNSPALPPC